MPVVALVSVAAVVLPRACMPVMTSLFATTTSVTVPPPSPVPVTVMACIVMALVVVTVVVVVVARAAVVSLACVTWARGAFIIVVAAVCL